MSYLRDAAEALAREAQSQPLIEQAKAEGAREALAQLDTWLDEQARKHPRFNGHMGLCRLNVQRFRADHYPEEN